MTLHTFPMIVWSGDDETRGETDRSTGAQQTKADEVAGASGKTEPGGRGKGENEAPGRHREPFTSM